MSAKSGLLSVVFIQLGLKKKLSVIQSSRMSAVQGLLSIELKGGQSRLSELSVISWVSAVEGCPLSSVPLAVGLDILNWLSALTN